MYWTTVQNFNFSLRSDHQIISYERRYIGYIPPKKYVKRNSWLKGLTDISLSKKRISR